MAKVVIFNSLGFKRNYKKEDDTNHLPFSRNLTFILCLSKDPISTGFLLPAQGQKEKVAL